MFCVSSAHSQAIIKDQIKAGQNLLCNDDAIRAVFKSHAQVSEVEIDSAYIEKHKVLDALKKLGVEMTEEDFEKAFHIYDTNGDGSIDEEEFKQIVLSQTQMPSHDKSRHVFDTMCQSKGKTTDAISPCHITLSALTHENLKALEFTQKRVCIVLDRLARSPNVENDEIDFDEFHHAVLATYNVLDEHEISTVFRASAVRGKYLFIPRDNNKIRAALKDLSLVVTADHLHDLLHTVDLNFNGRIDFHAFKHIVLSPSPVVAWAQSLPIAALLADAMPKHEKCDHLRVISTLKQDEIGFIADAVCAELKEMLRWKIAELKSALRAMDEEAAKGDAVPKYVVSQMKAGDISHFHEGLRQRIGEFLA